MARRKEDKDKDDRRDRHHHDKDHKPGKPPPSPGPVSESIKAQSHQSGQDAMNAVPGSYPAEPANAEAVYTTGPGQAVEYNYKRLGTYSEDYARQQSEVVTVHGNPVAGPGQIVTSGAANNPT